MNSPSTPFPILSDEAIEKWHWPAPPFAWRHRPAPGCEVPQPCRVEGLAGAPVAGEMLGFDPAARMLTFRTTAGAAPVELAFTRFRRLTLLAPLRSAASIIAGAPVERIPAAAHERDYRLQPGNTAPALTGRTVGHVETTDGMFLFTPTDEEASVQRVFVPRPAYVRCEFGESSEEVAARMWIASPRELLAAIEKQERMPVLPLGQSLLELGLVTPAQLERALARQTRERPLGESLVADGIITRSDLQTALAHKMGYPLVDLARFPIDPIAVAKLPQRVAIGHRAIPLMLDGARIVVAVDKPARVIKLRAIHTFAQLSVVPVLAPRLLIMAALERLTNDVWSGHVSERVGFFATTV